MDEDNNHNQMPTNRARAIWEHWRQPLVTAAAAGAFSLMGIFFGSQLSSHSDQVRWERETQYSFRREMVIKRMDLIDKSVRFFSEVQVADFERFKGMVAISEGQRATNSRVPSQVNADAYVESVRNLKRMQAEMSSLLFLSSMYFGPKTKTAVEQLLNSTSQSEVWWNLDKTKTQALLDAELDELNYASEREVR